MNLSDKITQARSDVGKLLLAETCGFCRAPMKTVYEEHKEGCSGVFLYNFLEIMNKIWRKVANNHSEFED